MRNLTHHVTILSGCHSPQIYPDDGGNVPPNATSNDNATPQIILGTQIISSSLNKQSLWERDMAGRPYLHLLEKNNKYLHIQPLGTHTILAY